MKIPAGCVPCGRWNCSSLRWRHPIGLCLYSYFWLCGVSVWLLYPVKLPYSNYIWLVFGITGFLISMLAMFFWQLPILFIILLLMGMGTTLTGLVVGYKTVTICGTLGALSSIGCLFYPGPNQILIFAPVFIFMMVIPGHVLNHAARKQKKS